MTTLSVFAGAQQPPPSSDEASPVPTEPEVKARLSVMEADAGIEDPVKAELRGTYEKAIESINEAAENAAKAAAYREALETAAGEEDKLRLELEALPRVESAARIKAPANLGDLQEEVEASRAALAQLKIELEKASGELVRVKRRPVEISTRLPEARRELDDTRARLASPEMTIDSASPRLLAERTLLEAAEADLLSELEMLTQEQQSQSSREDLAQVQSDLLTRKIENGGAALGTLEAALNQRLAAEAKRVVAEADMTLRETETGDEPLRELAAEIEGFAKDFESVVTRLRESSTQHEELANELSTLVREDEIIREQLELDSAGGAMARRLFGLRQRLPSRRGLAHRVKECRITLGDTRLEALDIDEAIRKQAALEQQFADRPGDTATRLLNARREVLAKLKTQYGFLVRSLAEIAADATNYLNEVRAIRIYLEEELFWVRSSPPVNAETLTGIPGDIDAVLGVKAWAELGGALARMPVRSAAVLLFTLGLFLARRRLGAALEETGTQIRRISTDRYAHTGKALLFSLLMALPLPLLMIYASWALAEAPDSSVWLRATSRGLLWSSFLALALLFLAVIYRSGGLGTAHFGWSSKSVARLRRAVRWFAVVYVPALLLIRISFFGTEADHFDSLGRTCFIVAHSWAGIVLWKLFRPSDGVFSERLQRRPTSLLARTRYLWISLIAGTPFALVLLACSGYLFTAVILSLGLVITAEIVATGVILYWLTLRWFMIRERKLALAQAIEQRQARRKAAAEAEAERGEEPSEPGEVVLVEFDEDELDLPSIGEQTRHLLEFLFALGVVLAAGLFWSGMFPVFSVLDRVRLAGLSLGNLGQAALTVFVTVMTYRNLPGLLELAVFGGAKIQRGTRVAVVSLCQYIVVAVGLVVLSGFLQVDWAKFGWIAAALSVGLGFGLQEVVANFVCGLILLFERPIRVGDVVTVEGMTGTVSRIQMRATTIINWDRQEFVVPNKIFITGTILNWTLSNSINRVIVSVGVAYGSDTEKARRILREVAADHPLVLDDPVPMATFEEFGDSTLAMRLRAYLPDTDNRLKVITELHAEIDKRFAEAGIEIAFPQRDLHIRDWPGLEQGVQPKDPGKG